MQNNSETSFTLIDETNRAVALLQRLLLPAFFLLFLLSLLGSSWAQAGVSQSVRLPNQEYTESSEDIKVKVLGGHVRINRSWVAGQWYLNPAWANLRFLPDPLGGVLAIDRAGSMYKRTAGGTDTDIYAFGPDNFIARHDTGWRWHDRQGHSVTYDEQGRIMSYVDMAGVTVNFSYDSNGMLNGVLDHHGQPALNIETDAQGRVIQVNDAREPSRKVRYNWSGNGSASLLAEVTDLLGHTWSYTYNSHGQITQRTDPLGATIQLTYMSNPGSIPSSPGFAGMGAGGTHQGGSAVPVSSGSTKVTGPKVARVASYTNEAGAITNYRVEWDRTRQQYTLYTQEPNGLERTTVYDKDGLVLRSRAGGLVDNVRSIDSKTQERITDARGLVTTYQYNSARQPLKIIYPDGSSESYAYDSHGRKTKHINALGVIQSWAYNTQGHVTQYVEALGLPEQRTTLSTYDQYGQLISQSIGAGTGSGADAVTYSFAYDSHGNQIKSTNPLGHSTEVRYNSQGLPLSQTDALGQSSQYGYDAAGHLLTATNPLNETASQAYDARGRNITTTSAEGRVQTTRYDTAGRVIEIIAPGQTQGQGTRIEYDSAGRPDKTISPSGLISSTEFDQLGRMVKTIDPAGNSIRYEYGASDAPLAGLLTTVYYPTYKETYQYDQRGRQTGITQHLGGNQTRTQRQSYDASGQTVSSTDPAGKTTLYQYDALGRLTKTTDALAQTTEQTWDAQDNLLSLTDAAGNTHRFEYDTASQLLKETRPLGGVTQYAYNEIGQLTQRVDAGNHTRDYTYDAVGRLVEEAHKLGGSTLDQRIRYQFNKDGQLTSYEQTDGSNQLISSASYTLDEQGRTASSNVTYGKTSSVDDFSFSTGQGFNADGQLQSHTYPDGSQQRYVYTQGQLSTITLPNQSEITYENYNWVMPEHINTPGASKTLTYDALLRPVRIEVKNQQAHLLAQRLYQYDATGNISQIESDLGVTDYGYDKLDRLIQANPSTALQALNLPQEQYSYDPVGNRTVSAHQPGNWTYNADNQLTQYPSLKPFSLGASPVETQVSYSPQGHTQQETNAQGTKDYHYNAAERLIGFTNTLQGQNEPIIEAHYRYDPFGRRISKTVTQNASSNSSTTWFIYSEQGLMAEANEQGELSKAYGFNPVAAQQGLWSTDPIWQANVADNALNSTETTYHYLHTDHLYTPILATNKEGSITWKAVQEAFGAMSALQNQSRISMNLRFPGQYYDVETGTHYNYRRDYRSSIGRYIEVDPLGLRGSINFYGYSKNKPLLLIDPEGDIPTPIKMVPPDKPLGDGCGDESTDSRIPDAYIGFDFSKPCRQHDICYGTCGNPKSVCDINFLYDMLGECARPSGYILAGLFKMNNPVDCILTANAYYIAVRVFGLPAYCAAQAEDCPECEPIPGC